MHDLLALHRLPLVAVPPLVLDVPGMRSAAVLTLFCALGGAALMAIVETELSPQSGRLGLLWRLWARWSAWRQPMLPEDLTSDPALAALVRDNERVDAAIRMWCGEDGR